MFMNQRASFLLGTVAAVALAAAGSDARADQINVSAIITAECSVAGDADLAFGNYSPLGTEATTSLNITCTAPASVGVTLGGGQSPNGSRRMTHSTDAGAFLSYQLYNGVASGGQGQAWNQDTEVVFDNIATTGTDITIGGYIPGSQTGPSGTYNDVVLVTLDVKS